MPHLAQLDVARLAHPLDRANFETFVSARDAVNAVADRAPGLVWRLPEPEVGDAADAGAWREELIVNLSVWADLAVLEAFDYGAEHAAVLKQRRMFFQRVERTSLVLWWVPEGHEPTLEEARERLDRLETDGPTPFAFTMRNAYPPEAAEHAGGA